MRNIKKALAASTATIAPVSAKPARTVTVKPGKAKAAPATAKPAAPAPDAKRSERAAVLEAHRATVSRFYAEASLTVHKRKAATLDTYAARVQHPVQRIATGSGPSERDQSLLALIHANSDKAGTFDPVALAADAGVISRLASIAFITYDAKAHTFSLTAAGRERAAVITRKAS